jgi:hypothetical protein
VRTLALLLAFHASVAAAPRDYQHLSANGH